MERSRRKTLASIAGVIMVAGCGQPEASLTDGEQSTPGSDVNRFTDGQMAGSTGPDVSFDELVAQYDADIYVVVRNEEFSALDSSESELAQGTNLGRVINEATATISGGLVVVAASGSLSVPV